MRNSLTKKAVSLTLMLFVALTALMAQDVTTVEAKSQDISDHLDLEAVASIFGDAKDLEDFEKQLNDPETHISNLDLNEDGYVDYLRVIELAEENAHVVVIQSVLEKDVFQDVATIEVEKDNDGITRVQVVGDVYLYGEDYIIEPVYVHRPVFFVNFWRPYYRPYYSTYYWGYYPHYYHHWHPYHYDVYYSHIHTCINVHHTYYYTTHRRSHIAYNVYRSHRRNDYGKRHPSRSFASRRGTTSRALNRRPSHTGRRTLDASKRTGLATKERKVSNSRTLGTKTGKKPIRKGEKVGVAIKDRNRVDSRSLGSKTGKTPVRRGRKISTSTPFKKGTASKERSRIYRSSKEAKPKKSSHTGKTGRMGTNHSSSKISKPVRSTTTKRKPATVHRSTPVRKATTERPSTTHSKPVHRKSSPSTSRKSTREISKPTHTKRTSSSRKSSNSRSHSKPSSSNTHRKPSKSSSFGSHRSSSKRSASRSSSPRGRR